MTTPSRPTERGMRITETAHANLSQLTFALSAIAGRRLSLSEVISVAVDVARQHQGETLARLNPAGMRPVAAAIVTSSRGVLAGRRNDGRPPWTFIAGEVEPGETAAFAAAREVKEETGLEVRVGDEIGRRIHPATGRLMIYVAADPVRADQLETIVGDPVELAEVRWLTLPEADELLPGMFAPVRAYLDQTIAP